jgi:hypothetical protein
MPLIALFGLLPAAGCADRNETALRQAQTVYRQIEDPAQQFQQLDSAFHQGENPQLKTWALDTLAQLPGHEADKATWIREGFHSALAQEDEALLSAAERTWETLPEPAVQAALLDQMLGLDPFTQRPTHAVWALTRLESTPLPSSHKLRHLLKQMRHSEDAVAHTARDITRRLATSNALPEAIREESLSLANEFPSTQSVQTRERYRKYSSSLKRRVTRYRTVTRQVRNPYSFQYQQLENKLSAWISAQSPATP